MNTNNYQNLNPIKIFYKKKIKIKPKKPKPIFTNKDLNKITQVAFNTYL